MKAMSYIISVFMIFLVLFCFVLNIVCVLQLVITLFLNLVSAALAIAAVALYSIDLMMENNTATPYCKSYSYYSQTGYSDLPFTTKKQNTKICLNSVRQATANILVVN